MSLSRTPFVLWSYAVLMFFSATDARTEVDYINGWDGQLFPPYIVATATMRADNEEVAPEANNEGEPAGVDSEQADGEGADSEMGEGEEWEGEEGWEESHANGKGTTKRLLWRSRFIGELSKAAISAEEDNTPIDVRSSARHSRDQSLVGRSRKSEYGIPGLSLPC
ncbi:MAG: hypothetical protein U1D30_24495 [Planctomycetota bacterium]